MKNGRVHTNKTVKSIGKLKAAQVFTPPHIANQMLEMLDQLAFKDDTVFFEPSCGNGNILIEIIQRIYKEYEGPAEERVAIILFKIFAIELDPILATEARTRVYELMYKYLTADIDYQKLTRYLIANLCIERIQEKDFFAFMKGKQIRQTAGSD